MDYRAAPDPIIGQADNFLAVLEQGSRVAPLAKPVLIIGERGSGKELIGARLHYLSERWARPYVKFNCAALNEELLESELFGHVAGAYTGAARARVGRFELANGGTLFLDELASMSMRLQEKLLRVVEYGEFERVGSSETIKIDVRLVGAANVDLPAAARAGRFACICSGSVAGSSRAAGASVAAAATVVRGRYGDAKGSNSTRSTTCLSCSSR